MKKILIAFVIIIILALAALYVFIPSQLQINRTITINSSLNGAGKILNNRAQWQKWWPGGKQDQLKFNNIIYTPEIPALNTYKILMQQNTDSAISFLFVLPAQKDSISLLWSCSIDAGFSPFTRLKQYRAAVAYADNMQSILEQLKKFLEQTQNIYGIQINNAFSRAGGFGVELTLAYAAFRFIAKRCGR